MPGEKFVFTGIGLGLLIGVTLVMAGVYRGMVDDGKALLDNSGADLWVVQKDTLGPYAEPSSLNDDVYRTILAMPGVAQAANVTYLTMQGTQGRERCARHGGRHCARRVGGHAGLAAVSGRRAPDHAWPLRGRGRHRRRLQAGRRIRIRRNHYTVVGLTRRMVSSSGDPMVFIPLKDAQEAQFLKDNDAIWQSRRRTEANPAFNRPGVPGSAGCRDRLAEHQRVRQTVLVRLKPGHAPDEVAESIRRWKRLTVYTARRWKAFWSAS
jgi:putative ABC transport system permease protein